MNLSPYINLFLLLFGALQGVLISIILLRKRDYLANRIFAFFIIAASLQIFHKVVQKVWLMDHVFVFYKIGYELPFIFGPLLWFYIWFSVHPTSPWRKKYLIHFLPFFYFASVRILYFVVFPYNEFLQALLPISGPKMIIHMLLQLASISYYSYVAWKTLHHTTLSGPFFRWLKGFIIVVFSIEILIIIALKLMIIYYGRYTEPRLLFLSLTVLIYWVSYQLITRHDLILSPFKDHATKKYAHSGLKSPEVKVILNRLKHCLQEKQLYLNPELTLEQLAKHLGTPKHHLSQVMNEQLQQSFHELINAYRLEHAKKLLRHLDLHHLTIAAIAYDSGFRSISNFNALFKKQVGVTPSIYRKRQESK